MAPASPPPADNDNVDEFRHNIAATCRALSHDPNMDVQFLSHQAPLQGTTLRLKKPDTPLQYQQIRRIRGEVDATALRLLHHDADIHARYAPQATDARQIFDILEQARCESIGARHKLGVHANISGFIDQQCRELGIAEISEAEKTPLQTVMALLARERLCHFSSPLFAARALDHWRPKIQRIAGQSLAVLKQHIDDQPAFARATHNVLNDLGFAPELYPPPPDDADDDAPDTEDEGNALNEGEADPSSESSAELESSDPIDASAEEDADERSAIIPEDMDFSGEDTETSKNHNPAPIFGQDGAANSQYNAYTTEFDHIVSANELCEASELERLRSNLDQQLAALTGVTGKLANRMQRRLLAKQTRAWEFDLEEGYLDTGRLARIITNPLHSLSYKMEKETGFRDTVVSLLIDNSGSMRGRPILIAAMTADILARTLERCGVKTEILGFTTCAWKGGKTRERWLTDGKQANAGRLNDLLHIIYKAADMPWRRARKNLGLMLREGMLKENIDGEALCWARDRLLGRPEQRRILMVISDGAPVDDSTLSTNPSSYLERHLREVIRLIENDSPIELLAIGIGHDVTRYYKRAVTLVNAEELSGAVMEQLASLFDADWNRNHKRPHQRSGRGLQFRSEIHP